MRPHSPLSILTRSTRFPHRVPNMKYQYVHVIEKKPEINDDSSSINDEVNLLNAASTFTEAGLLNSMI